MADTGANNDINSLKKTKIQVFVDEALPDILVVTYEFGVKIFKGVLLDSTKRSLPCGVSNLNPALEAPPKNLDDDTLYSVNQRYAYADPNAPKKKNIEVPRKYKTGKMTKMTVRLRPRQVLCSKCKGICNENSENVSKKTRSSESSPSAIPGGQLPKRGNNAPITRSVQSIVNPERIGYVLGSKRKLRGSQDPPTLVPKLTRLTAAEEDAIANGTYVDTTSKKPLSNASNSENTRDAKKHSSDHSDSSSDNSESNQVSSHGGKSAKRALRKKRSVGSMEDLWDETTVEEKSGKLQQNAGQVPDSRTAPESITRTIKISYGPQGEGTVLKIPAQLDSVDDAEDFEENVSVDDQTDRRTTADDKAARKALKKAKKEARRKILLSGGSPMYLGATSPRYGLTSPRYTVGSASPRHGLANNSPRYMMPPFDPVPRRRKHKVKHKKKHREDKDRKHKEGEVSSTQDDPGDQLITQKLSINLKRLNNSSYTPCPPPSAAALEENASGSSDEHVGGAGEQQPAPDFPPPNPPLVLRVNAQAVSSATGADGARLLVGDVVWGKIHGFPWWPGKILTITSYGGAQAPQAHVSWYGSSTSSLMRCDQLDQYLDNFKIRYNKKKKGPYKEAVKQATMEAQENAENRVRQPLADSPSHNIMQVVSPALASPREIDVVS